MSRLFRSGWIAAVNAVLCVVCVVELGAFFVIQNEAAVYGNGHIFPVPSGYRLDERRLEVNGAPCHVIRVTADACPYCKRDIDRYRRITQRARERGCQVIDIAPRVNQMALRPLDPAIQLQYVDMQFGRALYPYATPQTIVLDRRGRMRWQRQGALDEGDLHSALRALEEFR